MRKKPGEISGTPEPGDGRRIPSINEVFDLLGQDEALRQTIEEVDRMYEKDFSTEGKRCVGTKVRVLAHYQCKKNVKADLIAAINKRAIELAMAKKKGVLTR